MSALPRTQTQNTLLTLLKDVIDYAGLFPPARLPLADAFTNYLRYQQGSDAWMLSRFVIRAEQLPDLTALCHRTEVASGIGLSVLVGGQDEQPHSVLRKAVASIQSAEADTAGALRGDMIETSLALRTDSYAGDVVGAFGDVLADVNRSTDPVFFEAPWTSDTTSRLRDIAVAVQSANNDGANFGLKIRAGGLSAELFPSPSDTARFIRTCLEYEIPFKATAGLHHPIRHYRPEMDVMMHGFLNVMAAAILGKVHDLGEDELRLIIEDTSAESFQISEDGLAWKHLAATSHQVDAARSFFISFGSCSFDEPRDDLRELGWLPAEQTS